MSMVKKKVIIPHLFLLLHSMINLWSVWFAAQSTYARTV